MLILRERVAGLRRWHCLVLPAPLAATKQQMHLLGQITHCRNPGTDSRPGRCWQCRRSSAQVGQEFKGSSWGWLGCRAGSCTSPSSLSQPASKQPRLVCPVPLFLEFLAQHPKTIPAPQNNLSTHKQPRGGAGTVTCSSSSSWQGWKPLIPTSPRMGWILHSEQIKEIRSTSSDLQDGQELLTATYEE